MKNIIVDLNKNYDKTDIMSMNNQLLRDIINDIQNKTYENNEYMFKDIILHHFKNLLNNRLGSALSMEEFKNLPAGDLQPLLEYKSGDMVLYKEGNQYKFAQIVSEYDKTSPNVKYITNNNEVKEGNIGDFYVYPNNEIKQIDETFNRTINNDTEIYKI